MRLSLLTALACLTLAPALVPADDLKVDPVAAAVAAEPGSFVFAPEVVYGRKNGVALTMDVFTPKKNANGAGAIFIVSGGWYSDREGGVGFYAPVVREFLSRGYTVFTVCHGAQPKFTIPEIVADVNRAVRYIRTHAKDYGISPDRIGVSGASAGGHLSLMLGTAGGDGDPKAKDPVDKASSKVQAVACFFPPTDFLNYGGKDKYAFASDGLLARLRTAADFREMDPKTQQFEHITDEKKIQEIARKISPITHVSADSAPTLIVHGDADKIVPFEQAERFVEKMKESKAPVELLVKKGADHGWPKPDKEIAALADWFDKYLGKK